MRLRKIIGALGGVIFFLCAIVHFLTYRSLNLAESYPAIWALFPAALIVFLFTLGWIALKIGFRPGLQIFFREIIGRMPVWTWIVLSVFFAYQMFVYSWFGPGIEVPYEFEGKYIINNHGKITEYSLSEVEYIKLVQFRSSSAFWMWLLLFSSLCLLTLKEGDNN